MITTWSKGPADDWMPEDILVATLEKVRRHPWWHARARLALAMLRQNSITPPAMVMDAGCGWGVNLQALESVGYRATGMDVSRRILELIDQPNRRLLEADLTQATSPSVERFDALLALDVIEHLDDDRAAIRTLSGLVRPNGLAIISVPARPDLFSEFDRMQGHRRRYVPETLRAAFEGSDFEAPRILWWGAWMVPVLRRMRSSGRVQASSRPKTYADYLRLPPWPIPLMMRLAYAWEHSRALKERLATGTSLFAVARRR